MKDSTILIVVVAGFALLVWAFSKGIISSGGVPVGTTGIVAPQPSSNYSGYLAASTAPAVTNALNNAISGLGTGVGSLLGGWLGSSNPTPPVQQGASSNSPALAAQPNGPNAVGQASIIAGTAVGPVIDPSVSYDSTTGSAFNYGGMAASNAYDPEYSLELAAV